MCFLERMSGFILDLSRLWALFSRVKQSRPVHAPGNRTPHYFLKLQERITMEKEMFVLAKFKSGEGVFEKFMGWMQSDEGMGVRKSVAHVEKTVPAIAPDKSYIMFKLSVHNEEGLKELASGNNPIAKPIWDECIESIQLWELSSVEL